MTAPAADKPLWLLDVDGVLNAVNLLGELQQLDPKGNWTDYREGQADVNLRRFSIIWSPSLVERITAVHTSGRAEIRWLTTWETRAQTMIAPLLGLPHFELAGERSPLTEKFHEWWKLPMAKRAAGNERTLVWTDDDLSISDSATHWIKGRFRDHNGKAMLVTPRWHLGITPAQMDVIDSFLDGLLPDLS